ncbi:MAG: GNAT family N-acetyltransferase [Gemmatimonadaceae bacterium]|nr:GNAT family N-acetyltransferase [Gemmatimonadaceae bacterium]
MPAAPDDALQFTIRPATGEDLAPVSALLEQAQLAPNGIDTQFGPQFAVAIDACSGAVIGAAGVERYVDANGSVGLFRSAVVDDRWRGRGVGAALTRNRMAWAESERLEALYLLTETAADYWPRFGFERTSREAAPDAIMASHEWRHGCPASAVAMRAAIQRVRPADH